MRKLKVTEMNRLSLTEFHVSDKFPLVVVLDHVRSLYNVGSVFRTSDAFRLQGVCLCGITATPPHPEIHKTALGAEDSVEWKYFEKTEDAVAMLKEQGYTVLAIEQCEGSTMLQDFKYEKESVRQECTLSEETLKIASEWINSSQKPLVIAGHGVIISRAEDALDEFVTKTGLPVATTMMGLSAVRSDHPNYVGCVGMHGSHAPNRMTQQADLIIAVGTRLTDFTTA